MGTLWQDLRYSFRVMAKTPSLTTVAILSLALGIGANTAIFTLINALLLRDLPVRQPEQLVELLVKRLGGPFPFSYLRDIANRLSQPSDCVSGPVRRGTDRWISPRASGDAHGY